MKRQKENLLIGMTALSAVMVLVALYLALAGTPEADLSSETGRYAQRILHFHVAAAWVGLLAFLVTFGASVAYLRTQSRAWDIVALSSAEMGTVFMLGVLVSGSIWAKPVWGVWWVWDERLTMLLILFLIYVGYLMLRASVEDPARKARFAAVYGVVALVSLPISFIAIRLWQTALPLVFGGEEGGLGLLGPMKFARNYSCIAFTVWYATLMWHRIRLERFRDDVEQLKQELLD